METGDLGPTIGGLDIGELDTLQALTAAWNSFAKLYVLHPSERDEFMRAIHAAQNIVMSRPVLRTRVK